jgi:hypothetical protein
VYTLAAPFFISCPSDNPPLPVKSFPRLAANTATTSPGSTLLFVTTDVHLAPAGNESIPLFAAFFQPAGPVFSPVIAIDEGVGPFETTVPEGVVPGQTYFVLTNCGERVGDDTVLAGPAIVEVVQD